MIISIKKRNFIENVEALLLAIILCMNAIRYLINMSDGGSVLYLIYIMFIGCVAVNHIYVSRIEKGHRLVQITFFVSIFLVGYITLYSVLLEIEDISYCIKLAILLMIAIMVYKLPAIVLKKTISYILVINIIYSSILIALPNKMNSYMQGNANYLTMTLPLTIVLTITLSRVVCSICIKKKGLKDCLIDTTLSLLFFIAITMFASRSAFIFPLLCAVIISVLASEKHRMRLFGVYLLLGFALVIGIQIFMENASSYAILRMQKMLTEGFAGEDRWEIWRSCIELSLERGWIIFGGGVGALEDAIGFYPHNLYLQFISEMGILGIIFCLAVTIGCIWFVICGWKTLIKQGADHDSKILFLTLVSALLLLFFTFMKSFSIYDGVTISIFVAMLYNIGMQCTNLKKGEKLI